jgi:tRNA threonylcarbamoyl adenosine modification protein YeaZ
MILFINTAEEKNILVALIDNQKIKAKQESKSEYRQIEELLPLIAKLLKSNKVKLEDLSGIIVVVGPGGFTSIRIGVVTANILSFALNIPVVGVKKEVEHDLADLVEEGLAKLKKAKTGEIVMPFYDKEPNITTPKNRES